MGVDDRPGSEAGLRVFDADVHAAGKGDAPVHHQHLAMVAHVDERHAPGQPSVQEAFAVHATRAHAVQDGNEEITGANAIQQHAHFHAAL
jgi:hypothetical protein